MPAVISRQIYPVRLVVGRNDHTHAVKDAVLAQVLFVNTQHVRRRRRVGLHVVVKLEAVDVAKVARLVDAQDHRLEKPVEAAEQMLWRHFVKIPGAHGVLDGLKRGVLADPPGCRRARVRG